MDLYCAIKGAMHKIRFELEQALISGNGTERDEWPLMEAVQSCYCMDDVMPCLVQSSVSHPASAAQP